MGLCVCTTHSEIHLAYANMDSDTRYRVSMDSGNINAANTRWKTYQDPLNPLRREGYHGDCQFPQITAGGLQDSLEHGRDLYAVYGLRLGLTLNTVRFRVTNNVITSQVAGAVVRGMFPHGSPPPVELRVQYADSDSLEPSYTCPAAGDTRRNTTASRTWMDHLEASRELFARLDAMSDVNPTDPGWHNSLDHYFDSFTSRMCHGMPLPCSVSGSKRCVSREDVDQVLRWGQWEYSFLYRDAPQSLDYARMRMGVFLAELVGHLSLPGNVKYRHNVGHDGSISLLLSALQVEEMVWPGLGAEIAVELWHERAGSGGGQSGGGRFVRVLWGGKVMPSSSALGRLDMIPLGVFVEYLTALSGTGASEVMKLCGYEG